MILMVMCISMDDMLHIILVCVSQVPFSCGDFALLLLLPAETILGKHFCMCFLAHPYDFRTGT